MSRISYCSLEEAWGDSFNRKDQIDHQDHTSENKNKNNEKIYSRNKYDKLLDDSEEDRKNVINNMNNIERKGTSENNSLIEYNKYRFNSTNNVKDNSNDKEYSPFKESIEKKYLQDKINFLENEFLKYKYSMDNNQNNQYNQPNQNNQNNPQYEHFENNSGSSNNDLFDLIILIIVGLLVIFVLNSIFNIGKAIGSRQ